LDVAASRKQVAAAFGLTTKTVEKIEKEGLDAQWPPLDA
jgi:DNA-binding XRE family transcriptional regulator